MKTVTERPPTRRVGNRRRTGDLLSAERRAFERQRRQLLRRFPGEYVALYGARIVGHDKDCESLAARLFAKLATCRFSSPALKPDLPFMIYLRPRLKIELCPPMIGISTRLRQWRTCRLAIR